MALWLTGGTVSVSNGGTAVTGSGTSFLSARVGSEIMFDDGTGVLSRPYLVTAIADNTHLTISPGALVAYAGKPYVLRPVSFSMESDFVERIDDLLSRYDSLLTILGDDRILTLDKDATADYAEVLFKTHGVNKARIGLLGNDTFDIQTWNGSAWVDAAWTSNVALGITTSQFLALISVRQTGNNIEFGHPNAGGYASVIGNEGSSGKPFVGFFCGAGTTNNTYKTTGQIGTVVRGLVGGGLTVDLVPDANLDNQVPVNLLSLSPVGDAAVAGGFTAGGALIGRNAGRTVTGASDTLVAGDYGKLVQLNRATAMTLNVTSAATLGNGWWCDVINIGAGIVTIDPATSQTIDGVSAIDMWSQERFRIVSDGVRFYTIHHAGSWVTYTPAASSATGTIATLGTRFGMYKITRTKVEFLVRVTVTTVGTANGFLLLGMPVASDDGIWTMKGIANNGQMLLAFLAASATNLQVVNAAGNSYWADGRTYYIAGEYKRQES